MSSLSEHIVKIIIRDLCDYFGVDGIPSLANRLNLSSNAIYRWIERGSIPGKKLNKMFPELNVHYIETGEGQLLTGKNKPHHQHGDAVDKTISAARQEIDLYRSQSDLLKGMQLPPDAALELLRSSVRLIQAYIDAVEEVNKRQGDDS